MGDTPRACTLINYIDTKAKCRQLKILTCKGTLRQVFIRVYRLEIQSVMLVFSTCCLLSGSLPPPPSQCEKGQYNDYKVGGGGIWVWAQEP